MTPERRAAVALLRKPKWSATAFTNFGNASRKADGGEACTSKFSVRARLCGCLCAALSTLCIGLIARYVHSICRRAIPSSLTSLYPHTITIRHSKSASTRGPLQGLIIPCPPTTLGRARSVKKTRRSIHTNNDNPGFITPQVLAAVGRLCCRSFTQVPACRFATSRPTATHLPRIDIYCITSRARVQSDTPERCSTAKATATAARHRQH